MSANRVWVCKRDLRTGRVEWSRERCNLEVYGGATAKAHVLGGDTAYKVSAVGFGAGITLPALTDTALTTPAYYKPIAGTVFNGAGAGPVYTNAAGGPANVQFTWGLHDGAVKDYAAVGLTVTELGLFANPTGVVLPAVAVLPSAVWASGHAYNVGDTISDGANVQTCTTAGTSGSSHPTWTTTPGATVGDGSGALVWTCTALHTAPTLLCARVQFTIGLLGLDTGFTSSWTVIIPPGLV